MLNKSSNYISFLSILTCIILVKKFRKNLTTSTYSGCKKLKHYDLIYINVAQHNDNNNDGLSREKQKHWG